MKNRKNIKKIQVKVIGKNDITLEQRKDLELDPNFNGFLIIETFRVDKKKVK